MSGSFGRLTKARKSSSSRTSIDSGSPSLSSTPPASPPTRLLRGNDAALAAAASNNNPPALSVEFPRGTSFSRLGGGAGSSSGGGPPTVQSNSSMDSGSNSTGLYDSPSSTPPKKTWERNYKSFLKKSVGGGGGNNKHHVMPTPSMLPAPRMPHATTVIGGHHKRSSAPMLATAGLINNDDVEVQRIMNFSSDAFATNSNDEWAINPTITKSASSSPVRPSTGGSSGSTKEHSSRGGAFFRKLRSKTKSEDSIVDSLDSTMRRGVDRRSPTTTPPGSVTSTPQKHSPTSARKVSTIQDGLEKAAILSEKLGTPVLQHDFAPPFIPSQTTTMQQQPVKEHSNNSNRKHKAAKKAMKKLSRGNSMDQGNDNLDQAMHHGQGTFVAPSNKSKVAALKVTPLSRVKSMSSNLTIKEGVPSVISSEQEALMREKRKAFTDFHNQGVDSTSAFLGDESSLHRNSVFLSSMAYPAKASAPPSSTMHGGVAQSYDKRTTISPSTSENAIKSKGDQSSDLGDAGDVTPERVLRPVKGPESWKKGERHSIIPAILCMCPFQVLSRIMSDDGGNHLSGQPMLSASMTSTSSGYGIGSIISEDDHNDSNQSGWFFADHNHPQPTNHRRNGITAGVQPSAFGKIMLGKATVAALGVRSFFNEIYGWSSGVFVLRQNYLFEYRDNDNLNGLPWGYAHLQLAEAYPHKHFTNALHLDFFEKPCVKSGKRSLLMRVEDKGERDRWVSLLQAAARTTIHDLYDVDVNGGPECGRGRYAVVRPAKRRQNRRQLSSNEGLRLVSSGDNLTNHDQAESSSTEYDCALKIVNKKEFWSRVKKGAERADTLVREAAVQTTLAVQGADTPGFLRLRSIFETGEELVFELELLKGIDLFQHVSSRGTLDEMEAALIMRDLLHCLDVMDQIGIAHRDIKPANLLMCNENCSRCKIKMADFGMASFVGVDNLVRGRCGTPGFVAPEILRTAVNSGYENKVDVFSAGVTLYVMLAGYEPFYGESDAELVTANREAKVDFPHADWHKISVEGRDLVEKMLIADPSERISPAGALRHPWITRRAAINTGCGDEYEVQVKF